MMDAPKVLSSGPLRILVEGYGSIGRRHAALLGTMAGVDWKVLPARGARVSALRGQGVPALLPEEAVRFRPQAVVIATETAAHVAGVRPWLEGGAWVLVEKPLAPTLAATLPLGNCPRLRVACCFRADEGVRWLKDQVPRLGRIHAIRAEAQSYLPDWRPDQDFRASYSADPRQGGVLRDLIHEVDYLTWIFGFPAQVQGCLQVGGLGLLCDAGADLAWSLPEGTRVTLRLDYLTRSPRRRVWVDGSEGSLEVDLQGRSWTWRGPSQAPRTASGQTLREAMYACQMEAFLALARGGEDPLPLPGLREARQVLAVLDAARASSASGGVAVAVKEVP